MSEPVRLSKRVVALLGCSRAMAERYVEAGQVTVDGEVVDRPEFPVGEQRVEVDTAQEPKPVPAMTLLLHKPAGVAVIDPEPQRTALALIRLDTHWDQDPGDARPLRRHLARQQTLLPLEPMASGLQAFTQDPRLLLRMREQGARIEQEFIVDVSGSLVSYGLHRMAQGLEFQGRRLPPCRVSWQSEMRLRFAVKGVREGQLSAVCEQVGLRVTALRRIRIGGVPLAKLPEASWRYLGSGDRF
jgi:23S rRNA pseudouridine2604 synthase